MATFEQKVFLCADCGQQKACTVYWPSEDEERSDGSPPYGFRFHFICKACYHKRKVGK